MGCSGKNGERKIEEKHGKRFQPAFSLAIFHTVPKLLERLEEAIIESHSLSIVIITSALYSEPVQVSVTTWNQITLKILLPSVFDMEELLFALATKLQSKRCAGCPICRLQQSSMEVWIVTANGIGDFLNLFLEVLFCFFLVFFFARKT